MGVAPSMDVSEDFGIGPFIVRHNAPPGADRTAKTTAEVAGLALTTLFTRQGSGIVSLQHLGCNNPVGLFRFVASPIEFAVGL